MSIKISERAKRESKKQEAEERLSLVERYESVMESMIDRLTSLETDYSDACDLIAEQDEEIREMAELLDRKKQEVEELQYQVVKDEQDIWYLNALLLKHGIDLEEELL